MNFKAAALKSIKNTLRPGLNLLLILLVCCSLINFVGLIWVSDTWALVPDNDPDTVTVMPVPAAVERAGDLALALDPDGDGRVHLNGGTLILSGCFQAFINSGDGFIGHMACWVPQPKLNSTVPALNSPSFVKAYKDFGHLRIMPIDGLNIVIPPKAGLLEGFARAARGLLFFAADSGAVKVSIIKPNVPHKISITGC